MNRRALVAFVASAVLFLAGILVPTPAAAVGGGVVSVLDCDPGVQFQVDPIVNPDGSQSAHQHQFFGGEAIQDVGTPTDPDDMRAATTTCPFSKDTAGYWVPRFRRANGDTVVPSRLNVYYRSGVGQNVDPFPPNFGIVCGLDTDRPDCDEDTVTDMGWGCDDQEAFPTISQALPCPNHLIMHVQIVPTNDSFAKVTLHVRYQITGGTGYKLAGEGPGGDGRTMHGDFWNTWDQATMRDIAATLDANKTCKDMTDATSGCLVDVP